MVDLVVREPSKQLLDQLSAIFNALQFLHSLYNVCGFNTVWGTIWWQCTGWRLLDQLLGSKYLMPCNFSAQCNQCNFGSSMARYMRKHMMMMHSRVKRPQGGDSLTNRLEVKPPVALCTMHHSGMHQSMHYVVWRQESRLGEMGIGGGRRHKNASPPLPGTMQSQSSSAAVKLFAVQWPSDCLHWWPVV